MGLLGFWKVPFKLVYKVWGRILPSHDTRTVLALPVAGLDEAIAHQIVSTLRSAATSEDVGAPKASAIVACLNCQEAAKCCNKNPCSTRQGLSASIAATCH